MKSLLFGPAQRLDFVAKFQEAGADVGILDLEDATAEEHKDAVRAQLASAPPSTLARIGLKLLVRVNGPGTPHFELDLAAAAKATVDGIVVPMIEGPDDVVLAKSLMERVGLGDTILIGGVESARALMNIGPICASALDYVYFGAEDFVTDLGGRRTAGNHEVQVARSMVAIAARAGGIGAIDQVVADFSDADRFRREATEAADLGYVGKLCIHPTQVPLANDGFRLDASQIEWARGVIAAYEEATAQGRGVAMYEGSMIDTPILTRATRMLAAG